MLTITGVMAGHPFTLTWDKGKLVGDDLAVMQCMEDFPYMTAFAPTTGSVSGLAILDNPWTFYDGLYQLADDLEIVHNTEPQIPPLPGLSVG